MDKHFDLVKVFSKFGRDQNVSLRDPVTAAAFKTHVERAIEQALADPILLQGQRVEAMFEALLVSLGEFRLLKVEDGGPTFSSGEEFQAPDFRVVLKDGRHWLIEVKNVYEKDPAPQSQVRRLFKPPYYRALAEYAKATGAELKVAIFWARWQVWTLVSPERLLDAEGGFSIDMITAMKVNELGALGDRTIGTRAPLAVRFVGDPDYGGPIGENGTAAFRIADVQIFADGQQITSPVETEVVSVLMQYGEWVEEEQHEIEGDRLRALVFSWSPANPSDQGFDFVSSLSRMFARYYAEQTVEDKAIVQLHVPLRPNWFTPLMKWDYKNRTLRLWQIILQPNYEGLGDAAGAEGA